MPFHSKLGRSDGLNVVHGAPLHGLLPQLRRFLKRLETDLEFLRSHRLLDYSLLVGISFEDDETSRDAGSGRRSKGLVAKPGVKEVYYVELIDYLIKYST